jgi:hypothetical protein
LGAAHQQHARPGYGVASMVTAPSATIKFAVSGAAGALRTDFDRCIGDSKPCPASPASYRTLRPSSPASFRTLRNGPPEGTFRRPGRVEPFLSHMSCPRPYLRMGARVVAADPLRSCPPRLNWAGPVARGVDLDLKVAVPDAECDRCLVVVSRNDVETGFPFGLPLRPLSARYHSKLRHVQAYLY